MTEVEYRVDVAVSVDEDPRAVEQDLETTLRDAVALRDAIVTAGGDEVTGVTGASIVTPVVPVAPPPPPPPPVSAIIAGSCSQSELAPQSTDTTRVSAACSACMAEVDATQTTGQNPLHYRVLHCGPASTNALSCSSTDIDTLVARPDVLPMLQDQQAGGSGRRLQAPAAGSGTNCRSCVTPVTTHVTTEGGFTTYQLSFLKDAAVQNTYTIYGVSTSPMTFPAAKQVAAPFGADIGGVASALFVHSAAAEFDSWLTVGLSDGNGNQLGSIGIDFAGWTETNGLTVTDGAVFWMNPDAGPSRPSAIVAQVTVPDATAWSATVNAQGRSTFGLPDWSSSGIEFRSADQASDVLAGVARGLSASCFACVATRANPFWTCVAESAMRPAETRGLSASCSRDEEASLQAASQTASGFSSGCLSCVARTHRSGSSDAVTACATPPAIVPGAAPPPPCTGATYSTSGVSPCRSCTAPNVVK